MPEENQPGSAQASTRDSSPRASIVIPVRDEGATIDLTLDRLSDAMTVPYEVLVVYDNEDDTTVPFVHSRAEHDSRVRGIRNDIGRGPACALRAGFRAARGPVVVVTMADLCDDLTQIPALVNLVERGFVIAAASRFSAGGKQSGAPFVKRWLARSAGLALHVFARVGTKDATNSFKAYSRPFLETVGVRSEGGFEVSLELVAKARHRRLPVAEIPTIWLERSVGASKFRLRAWLPHYLRWFGLALTPRWLAGVLPPTRTLLTPSLPPLTEAAPKPPPDEGSHPRSAADNEGMTR